MVILLSQLWGEGAVWEKKVEGRDLYFTPGTAAAPCHRSSSREPQRVQNSGLAWPAALHSGDSPLAPLGKEAPPSGRPPSSWEHESMRAPSHPLWQATAVHSNHRTFPPSLPLSRFWFSCLLFLSCSQFPSLPIAWLFSPSPKLPQTPGLANPQPPTTPENLLTDHNMPTFSGT